MTVNRKPSGTTVSIPAGIAVGVLAAVITTAAGVFLTAKLIDNEMISMDIVGYVVLVIIITSSWIAAFIAMMKIKRMRMMVCLMVGSAYFMMLLIVTGLLFGGQYNGVGETALLIYCGSLLGFFTGIPRKNKRIQRRIPKV